MYLFISFKLINENRSSVKQEPVNNFTDDQYQFPLHGKQRKLQILGNIYYNTSDVSEKFNCSNIPRIEMEVFISHGIAKETYKGVYEGQVVAVSLNTVQPSQIGCENIVKLPEDQYLYTTCYGASVKDMLRQVFFMHRLKHPNLMPLLGFCQNATIRKPDETVYTGVVAVHEYGQGGTMKYLQKVSAKERLRHALEVASLMAYLEHSPFGSLIYPDFKPWHFLMVNGTIKLIDMDSARFVEPKCGGGRGCEFNLTCDATTHRCVGRNARFNLIKMHGAFYNTFWNANLYPLHIRPQIQDISTNMKSFKIDASRVVEQLREIAKIL